MLRLLGVELEKLLGNNAKSVYNLGVTARHWFNWWVDEVIDKLVIDYGDMARFQINQRLG